MSDDLARSLEPYAQAARGLRGWQLEYAPEPLTPGPPWNYESRARELASAARVVLDLGTGGGEVFLRVVQGLDCRAVATEAWSVNAPVASRHLGSKASVVRASSLTLPFEASAFDLVLSRHEAIDPNEVARVLANDGSCLTQQVIPDLWHELRQVFPDMTRFPDHFSQYREGFRRAGFVIDDAREFRRHVRFRELGHLVYYLVAAPWSIPDFSIQSHMDGLTQLHQRMQRGEALVLTDGYYVLEASHGG